MNKKIGSFLVILFFAILIFFFVKSKIDFSVFGYSWLTDNVIVQGIISIGIILIFILLIRAFAKFIKTNL
jgi:hypothetical protein